MICNLCGILYSNVIIINIRPPKTFISCLMRDWISKVSSSPESFWWVVAGEHSVELSFSLLLACACQCQSALGSLCLGFMWRPCSSTLPALATVSVDSQIIWFTRSSWCLFFPAYADRNNDIICQIPTRKAEVISIVSTEGIYQRELVLELRSPQRLREVTD